MTPRRRAGGADPRHLHENPLRHVDHRVRVLRAVFRVAGAVAPGTAARWAEAVFCRPPRHEVRAAEEQFLATGRRFDVPHGTLRIAAWEWGAGPTVMLAHGWGSRAGRFRLFVPALVEAGFRVVAHDGPAHGHTPGTLASLPEFAAALTTVAGAVGPVAGYVGHSLGGGAIVVAQARGLAAAPAVLISTPADPGSFSHRFARHLRLSDRVRDTMMANLSARLGVAWPDIHVEALVPRLAAPLLVIHDRDDHDVPVSEGRALARAARQGEFLETAGLGHRSVMRDPGVVRATVAFLARTVAR